MLVVPSSLQMGWFESPPYFSGAAEKGRDVAKVLANTAIGSLTPHKYEHMAVVHNKVKDLPKTSNLPFHLKCEVYANNFMSLIIPTLLNQVKHVANTTMYGIHSAFPPDKDYTKDAISFIKMLKGDGEFALVKNLIEFEFDGDKKTMWLEPAKPRCHVGNIALVDSRRKVNVSTHPVQRI